MYPALKHSHMLFALTTVLLFNLRFWLRTARPHRPLPKALRILPHLNDTLLLASGAGLAWTARFAPFSVHFWLGVKLLLVLLYIGCGFAAVKCPPRGSRSYAAYAACMLLLAAVAALARFKPF